LSWKSLNVHLTPKIFFSLKQIHLLFEAFGRKIFEFGWILDLLCPFKVAPEVLHDRVSGSLGRRLLMTSTQEPNTMAPQSALCICSRKWKTKLIVPIYFGTKTSKFCFKIISFSSLESELGFYSEDIQINFDRARSPQLWTHCLELWEQFAIFQATTGKTSLRTSCFYIRNGKLDTKWRSRQTKSRKENSRTALDGNFVT